ncbi:MAG: Type IV pilus biogenesis [Candidatus Electronema aureum]|uniref:Type IV pilus biogenesis n=1 Tax=Candidatus Electronema aureum TaxID=2005002 RepID=A0A521G0U0_9BACT|nr:MAG: Type IV pilus biogenesis [Candidatus Electronema aureum]
MIRVIVKLVVIAALAAGGVHLGYRELQKKLLTNSCLPALPKQKEAAGEKTTVGARQGQQPASDEPQNFQIIVTRDIFQTAAPAVAATLPEKTPQAEVPVVPTALKLILAGTVTGTEQTARAIIIDNTSKEKKQQLLQIGDGVQGAVIKVIDWNSITLDVNGKLEVLEMPKPKNRPGFGSPIGMIPEMAEPDISPIVEDEMMQRGVPPVRPNRRINLPPDLSAPEEAGEITEEAAPELPTMEELPPPPELPGIVEDGSQPPHLDVPVPPELPPMN